MSESKLIGLLIVLSLLITGCMAARLITGKKEKKILPRVLVLGVQCDDQATGDKIAAGILANLTGKVESFDAAGYELLISSITRKKAGLPPPVRGMPLYPDGVEPPIKFSSSSFYPELAKSQYYRTKVNLGTGLDYVVTGEARGRPLSELEEGNLVTAETAEARMLELRTGDYVVKESFKQGLFEIVAPDRIGAKLAGRINKYLSGVRKQEKREAKDLQRKFEED